jgi:NRAMP (natural resistance-associated macrophage protein)-like metal ion transporter
MESQLPAANRPPPAARPSLGRTLLMFFSVIGPGIITANADNDVGGIQTYSLAGAQFGYSMLWLLIPVTLALIVTQEMCARMGAVTGKGLADLIRENFGVRVTFVVLLLFVLGDLGNTAAEFAGIAYASPVFQSYLPFLNKYVLVIGAAAFVFVMVTRGSYKVVEKIFFAFCTVYLAYVVSGFLVHPGWHEVLAQTFVPHFKPTQAYLLTAIGVIGMTISPWMQFYIQSAVVEKGVRIKDYPFSRIDVITGAIITDIIAYFIIVSCAATIFVANLHLAPGAHPLNIENAGTSRRRSCRWPESMRRCSSRSACSTRRSSPPRSSRFRPPTMSARRSASSRASKTGSVRRRSSIRCIWRSSSSAADSC